MVLQYSAELFAESTRSTIDHVLPRMVKIFGSGKGFKGFYAYSTGFLVSPEGHIATVWSYVLDSDQVTVVLNDGRRFSASVVGAEPPLDLAVIKIDSEGLQLPYFDLNEVEEADLGTRVLAFSNMFKVATGDEPVSVMHGVIAARTNLSARRGRFQTPYTGPVYILDAVTNNPGAGGGVIASRSGNLLAMIGKELKNTDSNTWLNYAVPITELRVSIDQIITGIFDTPESEDQEMSIAEEMYRPEMWGMVLVPDVVFRTPAYIDAVRPGTPAETAGLRPDDLILFVNDKLVSSCRAFREAINRQEEGDTMKVVVRRGDQLIAVEFFVPSPEER
ncbi:MAG: S1C family serine protease [Planctomycetota bacterium]|nr:S1C family serine protease [Planctomycetota bacterium]